MQKFHLKQSLINGLFGLLLWSSLSVWAAEPPLPPSSEPLPPPTLKDWETIDENGKVVPEVTTIKKGAETIEEYRVNGELYLMKVTPAHGKSYYLYKEDQTGAWNRFDDVARSFAIPKWTLFRF